MRIESKVAPLDVGDGPLGDEATYVRHCHPEMIGDLGDVDEPW